MRLEKETSSLSFYLILRVKVCPRKPVLKFFFRSSFMLRLLEQCAFQKVSV